MGTGTVNVCASEHGRVRPGCQGWAFVDESTRLDAKCMVTISTLPGRHASVHPPHGPMDVVCERCNTEYEFDDALVSERGTTVKCTNCGHQFKVYRPSGQTGAPARPWMLRRADGTTMTFDTLAVLQRWITEGRVRRDDQLSRDGTDWKPLGSIAELESFFAIAEGKGAASEPVATPSSPRLPKVPPPPPSSPVRSSKTPLVPAPPPPPSPALTNTASGTLRPPAIPPLPSFQTSTTPSTNVPVIPGPPPVPASLENYGEVPPATATQGFTMGTVEPAKTEEKFDFGEDTGILESWGDGSRGNKPSPAIGPPPVHRSVAPRSQPPRSRVSPSVDVSDEAVTTSMDSDDLGLPTPRRQRGGSNKLAIGIGVGVALAAGAGVVAWQAGIFGSNGTTGVQSRTVQADRISAAIVRAEQSFQTVTRAGFEEARDQLTALLASDPDEPRLRAARAAVLALWGELVRQRAEDLEARAALGGNDAPTLRAEASVVRREAMASLDRARQDVSVAEAGSAKVTATQDKVRYERALGEATRVLGDISAAQRHLTAARAAGAGPEVDLLAALLARDGDQSDTAIAQLRALTGHASTAVRARLALARLLAARGDAAGARTELEAVTRDHTGHEEAQSLLQAITSGLPPLRRGSVATSTVPSAPNVTAAANADAGSAPTSTGTASNTVSAGASNAESSSSGSVLSGRSYDALVAEGERLQERGQRERARAAFMAAMALRPEGSEAITGLGFVELDAGNPSVAIAHFRRVLSINPRYSEAYIGLGEAYSRQGNYEAALRAYRDYLHVNPGGSRARMAQNQIEQLERRLAPAGTRTQGSGGSTNTVPTGSSTNTGPTEPSRSTVGESPERGSGSTGSGGSGNSGESPGSGSTTTPPGTT